MEHLVKFRLKNLRYPVTIVTEGKKLRLNFSYNQELINEVKMFQGARWNPEAKCWTIENNPRNLFRIQFLREMNPYAPYDAPLIPFKPRRTICMKHQIDMSSHIITRRQCICAYEMGTGKTLAAMEAMEASGHDDWLWVAPRSALYSVKLEFERWKICDICLKPKTALIVQGETLLEAHKDDHLWLTGRNVQPKFYTYENLRKLVDEWPDGKIPPRGIIFDESSRAKNPSAQRTQAALLLADMMRTHWGRDAWIILMSGSPSPKAPTDWWSQCVPGDTLVLTSNGPKEIVTLTKPTQVVVNSKTLQASKSWYNGDKQVYKICTKEGYEVRATEDHRFLVDSIGLHFWTELSEIKVGDKIVLNDHKNISWNGLGSFEEGYLIGHFYGDGSWNNKVATWGLWEKDHELIPYLRSLIPDMTYNSKGQNEKIAIFSKEGTKIVRNYGEDFDFNRSSSFYEGYIAGLFDTDGSVEKNRARLEIAQSDEPFLKQIQKALLFLGIRSTLHTSKEKQSEINGRKIKSTKGFKLLVSGEYAHRFASRIGFRLSYKTLSDCKNYGVINSFASVKSIKKDKIKRVYDISVPGIQAFSADGFLAHNCEIACPGFLREGDIRKMQKRMAIMEDRQSLTGGMYPHLLGWRDSEQRCDQCGEMEKTRKHDISTGGHTFRPCVNEVNKLYERMKGLVLAAFKKDCLDLPEKQYKLIELQPSNEMLRAASMINGKSTSAITALTLLRELSDGFQYQEYESGVEQCSICKGSCTTDETVDLNNPNEPLDALSVEYGVRVTYDEAGTPTLTDQKIEIGKRQIACPSCDGTGQVAKMSRSSVELKSPKEDFLIELLDLHEDVGRLVVYGGFTGSIDKITRIAKQQKWEVIQVDGRGWKSTINGYHPIRMLDAFQNGQAEHPRICFVGQPSSAGMGLNLTASPSILYYSNDFNAESRIQSEDRIHRPGMNVNRGATIYDLVVLKSDYLILNNLQVKRRLQDMTLGQMREQLEKIKFSSVRSF